MGIFICNLLIICYHLMLIDKQNGNHMINGRKKGNWLSIDEAANYIGIGKTTLYTMAREGQVPANKLGKKWVFEAEALDKWTRSSKPIESFFLTLDFNIESNNALREPQKDAYIRTCDFFKAGKNKAIIQIPVGCGKSGLASLLPLGVAEGRVLIIAPNLTIKQGLYEAMDITNRPKCFWRKTGVLTPEQMIRGPLACTLDTGNTSVAEKAHIVITNIHQLATNIDKWLTQFPDKFFNMIIIDEAHHSAADSWKRVVERFSEAKIIHLTATPFRSDRQEIDGELIYRYPFRSATLKGYIKRLKANYIAPSEVELKFADQEEKKYSLDEVLKLKEETWFSKGIALAKPCNVNIVNSSLQKLEDLRQTGTRHQLIAVACSINHAKEIRSMYNERGYYSEVIHSNQTEEEKEKIISSLKNGTLDCIIQVQMLGEGFDHPKLSVAAIFRPFRTLAPYIQFVGRIMRVVVQNDPTHPDNLGYIITHLGMNLDQRLKEFKQFENDDEAFWEKVIGGDDPEIPKSVREGTERKTVNDRGVIVSGEIVDSLWEEDFTTTEDKHIIDDLREKLKSLGLDPSQAEQIVKQQDKNQVKRHAPSEPFPIQPHREWNEAKKRLDEQAKRTAKLLLNNTNLEMVQTDIPYKYTTLAVRATNNYVAALMMVNTEINNQLGKERNDCTTEEFKSAIDSLESILQTLVRKVMKAKKTYDDQKN